MENSLAFKPDFPVHMSWKISVGGIPIKYHLCLKSSHGDCWHKHHQVSDLDDLEMSPYLSFPL